MNITYGLAQARFNSDRAIKLEYIYVSWDMTYAFEVEIYFWPVPPLVTVIMFVIFKRKKLLGVGLLYCFYCRSHSSVGRLSSRSYFSKLLTCFFDTGIQIGLPFEKDQGLCAVYFRNVCQIFLQQLDLALTLTDILIFFYSQVIPFSLHLTTITALVFF